MAKSKPKTENKERSIVAYALVGTAIGFILLAGVYMIWNSVALFSNEKTTTIEKSTPKYNNPAADSERREMILEKLRSEISTWELYENVGQNITFRYPATWTVEESTIEATTTGASSESTEDVDKLEISREDYLIRIYFIEVSDGEDFCIDAAELELPEDLSDFLYTGPEYTFIVGFSGDFIVYDSAFDGLEGFTQLTICLDEWLIGDFRDRLAGREGTSTYYPEGNPSPDILEEMYTIIATYEQIDDTTGANE